MTAQITQLKEEVAAAEKTAAELLKQADLAACPHAATLRARLAGAVDSAEATVAWLEAKAKEQKPKSE